MVAKKLSIYIEQGTDFSQVFPIVDDNGQPADLTGVYAAMQIKVKYGETTSLVTLTTANGGLVVDEINSTLTAIISAAQTNAFIGACEDVYDIKMTLAGKTTRPYQGLATISSEVTDIQTSGGLGSFNFSLAQNSIYLGV